MHTYLKIHTRQLTCWQVDILYLSTLKVASQVYWSHDPSMAVKHKRKRFPLTSEEVNYQFDTLFGCVWFCSQGWECMTTLIQELCFWQAMTWRSHRNLIQIWRGHPERVMWHLNTSKNRGCTVLVATAQCMAYYITYTRIYVAYIYIYIRISWRKTISHMLQLGLQMGFENLHCNICQLLRQLLRSTRSPARSQQAGRQQPDLRSKPEEAPEVAWKNCSPKVCRMQTCGSTERTWKPLDALSDVTLPRVIIFDPSNALETLFVDCRNVLLTCGPKLWFNLYQFIFISPC